MSERKITILTPEQEALIPVYQEKWKAIALSTEPINRQRAEAAIKAAYAIMGEKEPEIRFCSSPCAAQILKVAPEISSANFGIIYDNKIRENPWIYQRHKIENNALKKLSSELESQAFQLFKSFVGSHVSKNIQLVDISDYMLEISNEIRNTIDSQNGLFSKAEFIDLVERMVAQQFPETVIQRWIDGKLANIVSQKIKSVNWIEVGLNQVSSRQLEEMHSSRCYPCFSPIANIIISIWLDFCTSVLHLPIEDKKWQVFASVVKECGWIFCTENEICVVCDRPHLLYVDEENRLHAEGSPAIQFADGFSVYAYHGIHLLENYGKFHPSQWESNWLLSEKNAELRRVLIQGIGYDRLCQELQATELDSWQSYSLLRIDNPVDVEPIHLLKMTCPSTNYIHVLRVPPDIELARKAIKWVNWGVDPEEFYIQS